jgi:hypothetical protein
MSLFDVPETFYAILYHLKEANCAVSATEITCCREQHINGLKIKILFAKERKSAGYRTFLSLYHTLRYVTLR